MGAITEDLLHRGVGSQPSASWLVPTAGSLRSRAVLARAAGEESLAGILDEQAALVSTGVPADLLAVGAALADAAHLEDAAACLGRAVQHSPSSSLRVWALARVLRRLGRFAQAETCLSHLLAMNPSDVTTRVALGEVRRDLGDSEGALQALTGASRQVPSSEAVARALAETWLQAGEPARARKVLDRVSASSSSVPAVASIRAEVALASQVPRQAAAELAPHVCAEEGGARRLAASMHVALASGHAAEAWARFTRHIDSGAPKTARLLEAASEAACRLERTDEVLPLIEGLLTAPLSEDDRTRLVFARGALQDHAGDAAGAALSWTEGNVRLGQPFSIAEAWERVSRVQKAFPPPVLAGISEAPPARQAVVVVGAPGSGAGLVSSLLGAHPDVTGVTPSGTLAIVQETLPRYTKHPWPDCLGALGRPGATRAARSALGLPRAGRGRVVVQVGAEGLFTLGALPLLLPLARVVLVRRSAASQALSQFRRPLRGPGLAHTSSLDAIAEMDAVYTEMLSYWRYALPAPPVEVSHDALVAQPEEALGRLCRDLHMSEAPGLSTRVRRRASGHWRTYARWFAPLVRLDATAN